MSEERELVKKRGSFKGRLTAFVNFLDSLKDKELSNCDVSELQLRMGKIESLYEQYDECFAHLGTVWRVQRNPGFLKNFLTVGDWTARVWSEDCRESAILWTPPMRHRICDGTWSPTRLSLMLLVQYDGRLCLWDLLRNQHEPVLTVQVCDEPLLSVRAHDAGTLVVCGSSKGTVYMQELSTSLSTSDKNDKSLLTLMLERENKRERILEARMREIKLKMRQAEEGSPPHSVSDMDAAIGDKDLADAAVEYMQVTKKELAAL